MLSFWEKDSYYAHTDIIIIGAGLMGLWSALELKRHSPSLSVTILERNPTPLGASTRNAGFACFGSLTELLSDEARMGTQAMLEILEARYKGIQKIKSYFSEATIQYDPCGGYEAIPGSHATAANLDDHIHYLNQLLSPITQLDQTFTNQTAQMQQIGLKNFDHLVGNVLEAGIHSGKLVNALSKLVIENGVTILYGLEVKEWQSNNNDVEVRTQNGLTLKAHQLISCVNGFTQQLMPSLNIVPARGQIIVTKAFEHLPMKGTFHYDEGFYYWRNLGNRILIGGARNLDFEGEETTDLSGTETIRAHLLQLLREHTVTNEPIEIDQYWSGIMGFTPTKEPLIEQVAPNTFAVVACNGMGVALTPVIAEKLAIMVTANV